MTPIAILRPEPGASETLARARSMGLNAFARPLFAIEPVDWEIPAGAFDGLLLTSANAVRHAGAKLGKVAHLPVFAVGPATARAARDAKLDVIAVGDGGIADLLPAIGAGQRLLHLGGEERIEVESSGVTRIPVTVYRSTALSDVAELEDLKGAVVLIHSPRAGRRLSELLAAAGIPKSDVAIVAISPATAAASGAGWREIRVAEQSRDEALLALAAELCNTIGKL